MPRLPTGTVTFLFADVEGSTRRLEQLGAETGQLLAGLLETIRWTVDAHHGTVFETVGDAAYAAFARPSDAVAASAGIHRALAADRVEGSDPLRVRIAIHTGEVESRGRHYFGPALFRCARLEALTWGGQTLLSSITAGLVELSLPEGHRLVDRGVHPLKDLAEPEHVHELVGPDTPEFPPPRSVDAHPNNLPSQLPTLIGRGGDVAAVEALLERSRLVTITGPGGTGKTALALEIASRRLAGTPGGAWFVDLAPVRDPELVPAAVAVAIGVREQPPVALVDTLLERLRSEAVLLVLDNFEQVTEGAATLARLLDATDLRIIATSREPLRLRAEREYPLAPLGLARAGDHPSREDIAAAPSVQLFVERARDALSSFELTSVNAPAVAAICERLDGLPLAIELGAALMRVLAPDQLLARLRDRLDLLATRSRDLPERQRTLRAALSWSYDLLDEDERRAFEGLAVFADGFTLAAAEAVLGNLRIDTVGLVGALLDKSLLVRDDAGAEPRFRMLDTVRTFALERLAESEESEARWLALVRWARELITRDGRAIRWIEALPLLWSFEPEVENVVAAITWLDETGRHGELVELVSAASSFWLAAGRPSEARPWLRRAIDVSRGPSAWSARLLRNAGAVEHDLGATTRGVELIRASIGEWEALGDDAERADALRRLGASLYDRGERDEARRVLLQSAAIAASADDEGTQRASLADLAGIAIDEGDIAEAGALLSKLLDASTRVGDEFGVAMAHGNLSYVRLLAGDLDLAESEGRIAVQAFTRLNKQDILGWCLVNLAAVVAEKGELDEASGLGRRGLRMIGAQGSVRDLSAALDTLSAIELKLGDARRALRLAIAARRVRVEAELALTGAEAESVERHFAEAMAALGVNADAIEREVASEPIGAIVSDEIAETSDRAKSAVARGQKSK